MENRERIAELWVREMLKGYTKLATLLLLNKHPSTGYEIMREIEKGTLGFWRLTSGGVYPALKELEKKGYVVGRWEAEGERRKKTYIITDEGKRVLESALKRRRQMAEAIGELFRQFAYDIFEAELPPPPKILDLFPVKDLEEKPADEQIRILKETRKWLNRAIKIVDEKLKKLEEQR